MEEIQTPRQVVTYLAYTNPAGKVWPNCYSEVRGMVEDEAAFSIFPRVLNRHDILSSSALTAYGDG